MRSEWTILGCLVLCGALLVFGPGFSSSVSSSLSFESTQSSSRSFIALGGLDSPILLPYNGTCDATCNTCHGPTPASCLSCKASGSNSFLGDNSICLARCPSYSMTVPGVGSTCVSSCPNNTAPNSNKECLACHNTCLTCTGPGRGDCAACNTNGTNPYMTYDHKCLDDCLPLTFKWTYPSGFMECKLTCMGGLFNNGTDRFCHYCHPNCAECNNAKESDCKGCYKNGPLPFLYGKQCLASCPANTYKFNNPITGGKECRDSCGDGYFFDDASNYCVACRKECKTCKDSTKCLTCKPATPYFSQNQCLATCPAGSFNYMEQSTGRKECRATCGDGFVFKPDANFCYACDPSCLTCSDSNSTSCLSCNAAGANPIFISGTCAKTCPAATFEYDNPNGYRECKSICGNGFTVLTGTNHCEDCDKTCETCSGSPSQCTKCSQVGGIRYFNAGTCGETCPLGMLKFDQQGTKVCTTTCGAGFFTDSPTQTCRPCHESCASCSGQSSSECLTCPVTLPFLYQNECLSDCPAGLHKSEGTCKSACNPGFGLDATNACSPCNATCASCSSPTVCTGCLWTGATKYLTGGVCVSVCPEGTFHYQNGRGDGECIAACGDGFYIDAVTRTCLPCSPSCQTCDATGCLTCLQSSSQPYLYQKQCYATCPAATYHYEDAAGKVCIEKCDGARYVDGTHCLPCHTSCLTCQSSSSTGCLTCDPASAYPFASNGECLADCRTGTYKYVSSAGVQQCISTCGTRFIYDPVVNQCFDCNASCLECVEKGPTGCKSCDQAGTTPFFRKGECLALCPVGTFEYSNPAGFRECIDTCGDGFTIVGTQCVICHNSCQTCSAPSDQSCTKCDSTSQTPYTLNSQCLRVCPAGYYRRSTTDSLQECVSTCGDRYFVETANSCAACHETCLTCSGTTKYDCLTCEQSGTSAHFLDHECLPDCPVGTSHFNNNGIKSCTRTCGPGYAYNSVKNECMKCHPSCATCSQATEADCITCTAEKPFWAAGKCLETCPANSVKYYGDKNWKECLASCDAGSYVGTDGICRKCDSTCQECSSDGPQGCTTCNSIGATPFLVGSECLPECPSGLHPFEAANGVKTCKTLCGDGFILDARTKYCVKCDATCLSCADTDVSKCLSCDYRSEAAFLVGTECRAFCPQGTSHFDDKTVGEKRCVTDCGAGFFVNPVNSYCTPCDSTCLTCSGPDSHDCLSCNDITEWRYFFDTQCLSDCPNGYYRFHNLTTTHYVCKNKCSDGFVFNNSTKMCEQCHTSCATCLNTQESACVDCNPNGPTPYESHGFCLADCSAGQYRFVEADGTKHCLETCGDGFAVEPGTTNCKACHSSCATCEEPGLASKCKKCRSNGLTPYYANGECWANCPVSHFVFEFGDSLNCFSACPPDTFKNEDNSTTVQKSCEPVCKKGKYADREQQSCRVCNSTCSTCFGPHSTTCLFCSEEYPFQAPNNTCVKTCPKKYYSLDNIDGKRCVSQCPADWFWHYNEHGLLECVDNCDNGYKVLHRCVSREEGLKWGWWLLIIVCCLLVIGLLAALVYHLYRRYKKSQKKLRDPLLGQHDKSSSGSG